MTTLNKFQSPSVLAEKQCFPPTDENVRPATGVFTVVDIGLRRKKKKEWALWANNNKLVCA